MHQLKAKLHAPPLRERKYQNLLNRILASKLDNNPWQQTHGASLKHISSLLWRYKLRTESRGARSALQEALQLNWGTPTGAERQNRQTEELLLWYISNILSEKPDRQWVWWLSWNSLWKEPPSTFHSYCQPAKITPWLAATGLFWSLFKKSSYHYSSISIPTLPKFKRITWFEITTCAASKYTWIRYQICR